MKTILVPVDFSTVSANAADFAGNLAAFYGAELLLYHTYELPVGLSEYAFPVFDVDEMQSAAIHELEILKENTQNKLSSKININIQAEIISLEKGLEVWCDEINPSLVVMGLSFKNAPTRQIVSSDNINALHDASPP